MISHSMKSLEVALLQMADIYLSLYTNSEKHLIGSRTKLTLTKKCKHAYFAGQLDLTTSPLVINVFMQDHPLYQSLGELPNFPGFPFPFSDLTTFEPNFKTTTAYPNFIKISKRL